MRYAQARFQAAERDEIFRVYAAKHLQLLAGTGVSYVELAYGVGSSDFDAEQVVDDVASRICGEA